MASDAEVLNGGGGCLGVPVVLCLVWGVAFLIGVPYWACQDWRYARDGVTTDTGRVVGKSTSADVNGETGVSTTRYHLEVEYTDAGGETHRGTDDVAEHEWRRYRPGDRVPPIEYLRSVPGTHRRAQRGFWPGALAAGLGLLAAAWAGRRAAHWLHGRTRRCT